MFLPQLRLAVSEFVQRAMCAEDAGFDGVAFIDHLEAPGQRDESIWEAMSIATWVAAKTSRLRVGHLVLCDAFRHPAVLAKEAVTLSAASGGRFELGLGAGSWPVDFTRFEVGQQNPVDRVRQLERDLRLIMRYWGDTDEAQRPGLGTRFRCCWAGAGPE
ncbi:luciferase-like monooxygenase family protein [Mycobacterium ulcerans str. Harvey]|uniref:Luciferase-like monooxygenase family protein n=1 Tax=Mycobacterium ulcerans str. Harvey TaxID=1299332 RepID=A0ABN0QRL1_MYCUL|nr:luciferase-like monooxygenase family protein [Mycobacterium ulcerans str. Harvey]